MSTEKRLIDANELLNTLRKRTLLAYPNEFYGLMLAHNLIDDAPTVDAVEVVHGEWIAVPSSDMMTVKVYKCSECGKMRYGSYMPNFCQCCGAKMDGGVRNGL